MFYKDTLQALVSQDQVAETLHRGSGAKWTIRCMQIALYNLGYGDEMNWAKFMADGDYGGGSTKAVAAFSQRNGFEGDGQKLEKSMLEKMLVMLAAKADLAALRQAMADGTVADQYSQDGGTEAQTKGLQRLLYLLGYGEKLNWDHLSPSGTWHMPTMAAVKALGHAENLTTDGTSINTQLAKRIKDKVTAFYGEKLNLSNDSAGRRGSDISVREIGGKLFAWDTFFKIRLLRHEKGVFVRGNEDATSFVVLYREALKEAGLTDSAIRVMVPVSANEGALDAINTWDNAFLSFGMYQWTMGTANAKGELPALLKRIKNFDEDTFRYYYGRYGLDIDLNETNEVYGRLSLNGTTIVEAAAKTQFRDGAWAFRFWRSGLDPVIKLMQMVHAFERLYTFYHHKSYLVKEKYFVSQIVSSEYGVALILDHHVNRPAHPRKHLGLAMDQTGLSAKDPSSWTTADEQKLIASYLVIRQNSSMTNPVKRAETTQSYLAKGELSDERGSFTLVPQERAVDKSVFPRGLDELAFPTIFEHEEKRGTVEPPKAGKVNPPPQPERPQAEQAPTQPPQASQQPPTPTPSQAPTTPAEVSSDNFFQRLWKRLMGR